MAGLGVETARGWGAKALAAELGQEFREGSQGGSEGFRGEPKGGITGGSHRGGAEGGSEGRSRERVKGGVRQTGLCSGVPEAGGPHGFRAQTDQALAAPGAAGTSSGGSGGVRARQVHGQRSGGPAVRPAMPTRTRTAMPTRTGRITGSSGHPAWSVLLGVGRGAQRSGLSVPPHGCEGQCLGSPGVPRPCVHTWRMPAHPEPALCIRFKESRSPVPGSAAACARLLPAAATRSRPLY